LQPRRGLKVARARRLADHRSHPVRAFGGIPDRHRARGGDESLAQRLRNRTLDIDARAGRTLLALQPEGRADDAGGSAFEVSVSADDDGILTAHLSDARAGSWAG